MKAPKTLLTALLVAAVLLTAACKKDGIYRPADKISAITEYHEVLHQKYDNEKKIWENIHKDSIARHDIEKWVWNGKQLNRIDFYNLNGKVGSAAFVYDGNRLARVNLDANDTYVLYEYDGRQLAKMSIHYNNGNNAMDYNFDYDGKKISTITVTGDIALGKTASCEALALAPLLGDAQMARDIAQARSNASNAKSSEIKLTLIWKGDNIRSISNETTGGKTTYTYDSKTNPLQGLLATMAGVGEASNDYAFTNKNNITTADYINHKDSYSYTYSDDLPTSRAQSVVDHYTQGYRYVTTDIQYYEYTED